MTICEKTVEQRKKAYYATIHVLIDADNEDEACDTLSENFRNPELGILDWGYVSAAGNPTEIFLSTSCEEGGFLPEAAKAVGIGKL